MKSTHSTIFLFILVLLAFGIARGQWVPTNGPYCGGSIGFLYAKGNTLLAGVSAPWVSRPNLVASEIFLSTDRGDSWLPVYAAGTETIFRSIVSQGSNLFVGSTEGILESRDNGKTWSEPDTSMKKVKVSSLAAISVSGKHFLFAGTWMRGLYESTDGGKSWSVPDSTLNKVNIRKLAFVGRNLFAGTDSGIYISTDLGRSWHDGGLKYYWIINLAVMSGSVLFAQTNGGLFYSTDNGNEWIVTNKLGMRTYPNLAGTTGTDLYVFSDMKLSVSPDRGKTWTLLNYDEADLLTFCKTESNMYVGTTSNGIYRSSDNGKSWSQINNGLLKAGVFHMAASGKNIYAGTKGFGVSRSTDGGKEWIVSRLDSAASTFPSHFITALEAHGDNLYVRTWNKFYASTDKGASWIDSNIGGRQGRGFASSLAVRDSDIFASTGDGLLHSTDNGRTWAWSDSGLSLNNGNQWYPGVVIQKRGPSKVIPSVPPPRASSSSGKLREAQALAFKDNKIFAGITGGNIFVSTNDGVSWSQVDSNLTDNYFNAITVVDSELFALTEGNGIFRSNEDGRNWTRINYGLIDTDAHVLVNSEKNLFLGGGGGVYLSNDNGDHWTLANTGLIDSVIIGLTISDGYLYAGTWDYGVWKRSVAELVDHTIRSRAPGQRDIDRKKLGGH
ncbi:MAG TPA: YCF48-related protein [Candidatus Kryptonia bacterium]